MAELNLVEILEDKLLSVPKYVSENGKVLKAKVYEDTMATKPELIRLLLSSEPLKKQFFEEVDGITVFDKQKFAWLLENREFLPDSYTRYKNKIGLSDRNGNLISSSDDVVLSFPYKDCVLVGGQDKDDEKRDRKEIFFNEIIGSQQITRMLEPKVFTNAKRYTKNGIEENVELKDDDNLIIKGNNLIALSSLLERYEGKVKCIYIDPPYNTENDSFKYNDNFNHSTWLAFMKNRLQLAKKLLSDDGAIFVQCDDNEELYLGVLMDEIFGISNKIATITIKSNSISGNKTQHKEKTILKNKDSIHVYKKNNIRIKPQYEVKGFWDTHYNNILIGDCLENFRIEKYKNILIDNGIIEDEYKITEKSWDDIAFRKYSLRNKDKIFRFVNSIPKELKKKSKEHPGQIVEGFSGNGEQMLALDGVRMSFLNKCVFSFKHGEDLGQLLGDLWVDIDFQNTQNQGSVSFTNAKKPEQLIFRILDMVTNNGDIVLDFFAGSGTTAAVAHKMGRKYIGIEQMDYIKDITVKRMKKVVDGEQGGISKEVDWNGGGSFVYCELMENANALISIIESATEDNIDDIKAKIYADDRIIPYVVDDELDSSEKEFEKLDINKKKKALISLVDKNKLYVNYSDIDDTHYKVSEEDKAFTKSFYKEV